jgi:hypothetical protein
MCVCVGPAQGCNCLEKKKILSFKGKIESLSKFLMNFEGGTRYLVLKDEADTIV